MLAGSFKFPPARRIYIPKPGKKEKRPLSIANPRVKVVQKALELVLSRIYEPCFLPTSHGFRPGKSTHSRLKQIDIQFKGAKWYIERDVTKCFDSISHRKLMNILSRRIDCGKTLNLIRSGLKAGYVEMGGIALKRTEGTPQGSVLSPLLCNVFMHELDKFMESLIKSTDCGRKRKANPPYTAIRNKMAHVKIMKPENMIAQFRLLRSQLRRYPIGDPMDPNFRRLRYVRYRDDFLISVIGPKKLALDIKRKICDFLKQELGLQLNEHKTLVTNAHNDSAKFLGALIHNRANPNKKVILTKAGTKTRITARVEMLAPVAKLIRKLKKRKFIKWRKDGKTACPTGVKRLVNFSHSDIVGYYNMVTRGILNYYNFRDNYSSLGSLVRLLHMSCARTLALKYKLRFMAKAYKKFGTRLKCPDTGVELYKPITLGRIRQFNIGRPTNLGSLERSWANKLTRSNLGKSCIICGGIPAQMHHVRKIKELKSRRHLDWFTMQMAAINRKQVPLCRRHHTALHRNLLTPTEKLLFNKGCKDMIKTPKEK